MCLEVSLGVKHLLLCWPVATGKSPVKPTSDNYEMWQGQSCNFPHRILPRGPNHQLSGSFGTVTPLYICSTLSFQPDTACPPLPPLLANHRVLSWRPVVHTVNVRWLAYWTPRHGKCSTTGLQMDAREARISYFKTRLVAGCQRHCSLG